MVDLHIVAVAAPAVLRTHYGAGLHGIDVAAVGGADVHAHVVGAGAGGRLVTPAVAGGNEPAVRGPDVPVGGGRLIGAAAAATAAASTVIAAVVPVFLLPPGLDLSVQFIGGCLLLSGQIVQAVRRFVVLGNELGGCLQLAVQLRLAALQLGALLLQRLPVGLHLLAQLPQVVDDALVVLGHLVDEVDAAQKIAEAGGLEDHRPEGGGTPLLLIPHLTAEQVVLGLLLLLVVRQLRLQRIDLLLGVGDLAAEDIRLLIQQVFLLQRIGLVGLGLLDLLVDLLQLLLVLLRLLLQVCDGLGIDVHRAQSAAGEHNAHRHENGQQAAPFFLTHAALLLILSGTSGWRSGCRPRLPEYLPDRTHRPPDPRSSGRIPPAAAAGYRTRQCPWKWPHTAATAAQRR